MTVPSRGAGPSLFHSSMAIPNLLSAPECTAGSNSPGGRTELSLPYSSINQKSECLYCLYIKLPFRLKT